MVEGMYVGTKTVNYYNVSPLIMSISNQKKNLQLVKYFRIYSDLQIRCDLRTLTCIQTFTISIAFRSDIEAKFSAH